MEQLYARRLAPPSEIAFSAFISPLLLPLLRLTNGRGGRSMISSRVIRQPIRQLFSKRIFPIPTRSAGTFNVQLSTFSAPPISYIYICRLISVSRGSKCKDLDLWLEESKEEKGSLEYPQCRGEKQPIRISSRIDPGNSTKRKIRKIVREFDRSPNGCRLVARPIYEAGYRCFYRSVGKFFSVLRGTGYVYTDNRTNLVP